MRRLVAASAVCLVLAGCSASSPKADLQTKMNAITDAANAGDAAGLRTAVGLFQQEVASQSQNADITSTQAQALRALTELVLADAALLEATSPSPTPSSAAPSPSPSPTPPPSPSPAPSPSPEPTKAPSPDPVPSVQVTTSPAGLLGGGPSPSP
jgi:hypothetical protein